MCLRRGVKRARYPGPVTISRSRTYRGYEVLVTLVTHVLVTHQGRYFTLLTNEVVREVDIKAL